jgi:hypothetical protein
MRLAWLIRCSMDVGTLARCVVGVIVSPRGSMWLIVVLCIVAIASPKEPTRNPVMGWQHCDGAWD